MKQAFLVSRVRGGRCRRPPAAARKSPDSTTSCAICGTPTQKCASARSACSGKRNIPRRSCRSRRLVNDPVDRDPARGDCRRVLVLPGRDKVPDRKRIGFARRGSQSAAAPPALSSWGRWPRGRKPRRRADRGAAESRGRRERACAGTKRFMRSASSEAAGFPADSEPALDQGARSLRSRSCARRRHVSSGVSTSSRPATRSSRRSTIRTVTSGYAAMRASARSRKHAPSRR